MGKLKDVLLKIATSIGSDELKDIAGNETFDTIDIDDGIVNSVESKFSGLLTMESAKNNPEIVEHVKSTIHKPLKKSILGNLDESILTHAEKLFGADAVEELKGIDSTNEKLSKFVNLNQDYLSRHAKDPKTKEIQDQLKKQIDELNQQLANSKKEAEAEITNVKTGYESRLIDNQLRTLLSNYNLGSEYTKEDFIKNALYDDVISKVKQTAKLKLNEDGNGIIPLNPENPELPLYINNEKVDSVKPLVEKYITPFIKKQPGNKETQGTYTPVKSESKISQMAVDFLSKRQE